MVHLIPFDIEEFNKFIRCTDDHLQTIRNRTEYPRDAEGIPDHSSNDKKEVSEPVWQFLGWTKEEMKQWSQFRKHNDELYTRYKEAKGKECDSLKKQLDENIAACAAWDEKQGISERFTTCDKTYGVDREVFGHQTDKIIHETPLRTIHLLYEKRQPLNDTEKKFIEKYIALHEATPGYYSDLCKRTKELHEALPELWSRFYVAKDKADLATNTIYIPPAQMKGEFSPVVCFKVPSAEEQQQLTDDFNNYMKEFVEELNDLNYEYNRLYSARYNGYLGVDDEKEEEEREKESTFPLYDEISEMVHDMNSDWSGYSLDTTQVDSDHQEYLGSYSDMRKEFEAGFDAMADEFNVINDLYDHFVEYLNLKFKDGKDETTDIDKPDETFNDDFSETDDLREETIHNYLSGMGSPFFDVDDWHIIMDHFNEKRDEKGKTEALEKALTQHPDDATLLLRKAQEEINRHEYQKASELVKRAEAKGQPYHPNLYFIKADIFNQMHAPEQAIPLYKKVLSLKGYGLEPFYERARYCLLDNYEKQNDYDNCIPIIKELIEANPEDESLVSRLCDFYMKLGMVREVEEATKAVLDKDPDNAEGFRMKGRLLMEKKEYFKAAQEFEKSFNLDPSENYTDMFDAGEAFAQSKNYQYAVLCYEICAFYYPLNKDYHIAAAECYNNLKMPYAADFHYRKTLDLDPENTMAMQKLNMPEN